MKYFGIPYTQKRIQEVAIHQASLAYQIHISVLELKCHYKTVFFKVIIIWFFMPKRFQLAKQHHLEFIISIGSIFLKGCLDLTRFLLTIFQNFDLY